MPCIIEACLATPSHKCPTCGGEFCDEHWEHSCKGESETLHIQAPARSPIKSGLSPGKVKEGVRSQKKYDAKPKISAIAEKNRAIDSDKPPITVNIISPPSSQPPDSETKLDSPTSDSVSSRESLTKIAIAFEAERPKPQLKPKESLAPGKQDTLTTRTTMTKDNSTVQKTSVNLPHWYSASSASQTSTSTAAEKKTEKVKAAKPQYKREEAEFVIQLPRSSAHDKADAFMSFPTKQNNLMQAIRQVEVLYTSPITALLPPEQYIRQRPGGILGRGMVLKSDSVPGLIHDLDVMVYGAPNFRVTPDCPVYGVGQATRSGIRGVLNIFQKKHRTYWINLREEPVIYLNNRPFVLRENDFPFRNMVDFQGIDAKRLAQIEDRLKEDILAEAEQFGGNILVHTEIKNNELRPAWCSVAPDSVMTSAQVYSNFKSEGYDVTYVRVPVTAESSFTPAHFDTIVQTYVEAIKKDPGSRFIFNCQMGIGRSTMGMLTVYLLHEQLRRLIAACDTSRPPTERKLSTHLLQGHEEGTKLDQYRKGDYQCVNKLVRLVADSRDAKERVDKGIDACSRVYHVRDVIVDAFIKADQESDETRHKAYVDLALDALRRYFWLICFASYLPGFLHATFGSLLRGPTAAPSKPLKLARSSSEAEIGASTFGAWIDRIPSLWTLSDAILKTEFNGDQLPATMSLPADNLAKEDRFVCSRAGTVLGKFNIIKMERVWNQSKHDEQRGTPYFRTLADLPLSAVGQPTLIGIRHILDELQQQRGKKGTIVWINLREEPILYIQGLPALLRDVRRPFAGMKEFKAGMTPKRAIQLESRLKAEVLEELAVDGKLLIHAEECSDPNHAIKTVWKALSPSDVQTSTELFEALKTSGYNVVYHSIPLHVAEVPGLASIDRVLEALASVTSYDHVVFNCQMGSRRSTMGLALGYLLAFHKGDAELPPEMHKRTRSESPAKYTPRSSSLMLKSPSTSSLSAQRRARSQAGDVSPGASDTEQHEAKDSVNESREYRGILSLIRCMKKGRQMKWETDYIIEECSSVIDLRHSIALAQREAEDSRNTTSTSMLSALTYMESYAYLICVNGYLTDRFEMQRKHTFNQKEPFPSFSNWFANRKELVLALEGIRKNPERSLLTNTLSLDSAHAEVFEMRDWSVLIRGSLLKFDYFPGCRSNKINQIVNGSTNFRLLSTFPVGGCAIPTKLGIQNILAYVFGAHAYLEAEDVLSEQIYPTFNAEAVIWCNLREEPLIYINGKPFVLRDIDQPLDNLVQTGINGYRLEGMEKQLKYDVTLESAKWQGHFLVHDEDETGNLFAHWEPIGPGSIKTPQEIFTEVCATIQPKKAMAQQRAFYRRTPITDERAPTAEAVDDLLKTLECEDHRDYPRRVIILNCQMGRGRTTTGMVIACLWTMHRGLKPRSTYVADDELRDVLTKSAEIELTDDKEKRLKTGWYKGVSKLVRLLVKGRELKMELDRVIDECAALQNLRTAIYENLVHAEGALDRKRDFFIQRARDYLQRYCFLLVINSYLRKRVSKSFVQWLNEQPEIVHLIDTVDPV